MELSWKLKQTLYQSGFPFQQTPSSYSNLTPICAKMNKWKKHKGKEGKKAVNTSMKSTIILYHGNFHSLMLFLKNSSISIYWKE